MAPKAKPAATVPSPKPKGRYSRAPEDLEGRVLMSILDGMHIGTATVLLGQPPKLTQPSQLVMTLKSSSTPPDSKPLPSGPVLFNIEYRQKRPGLETSSFRMRREKDESVIRRIGAAMGLELTVKSNLSAARWTSFYELTGKVQEISAPAKGGPGPVPPRPRHIKLFLRPREGAGNEAQQEKKEGAAEAGDGAAPARVPSQRPAAKAAVKAATAKVAKRQYTKKSKTQACEPLPPPPPPAAAAAVAAASLERMSAAGPQQAIKKQSAVSKLQGVSKVQGAVKVVKKKKKWVAGVAKKFAEEEGAPAPAPTLRGGAAVKAKREALAAAAAAAAAAPGEAVPAPPVAPVSGQPVAGSAAPAPKLRGGAATKAKREAAAAAAAQAAAAEAGTPPGGAGAAAAGGSGARAGAGAGGGKPISIRSSIYQAVMRQIGGVAGQQAAGSPGSAATHTYLPAQVPVRQVAMDTSLPASSQPPKPKHASGAAELPGRPALPRTAQKRPHASTGAADAGSPAKRASALQSVPLARRSTQEGEGAGTTTGASAGAGASGRMTLAPPAQTAGSRRTPVPAAPPAPAPVTAPAPVHQQQQDQQQQQPPAVKALSSSDISDLVEALSVGGDTGARARALQRVASQVEAMMEHQGAPREQVVFMLGVLRIDWDWEQRANFVAQSLAQACLYWESRMRTQAVAVIRAGLSRTFG